MHIESIYQSSRQEMWTIGRLPVAAASNGRRKAGRRLEGREGKGCVGGEVGGALRQAVVQKQGVRSFYE